MKKMRVSKNKAVKKPSEKAFTLVELLVAIGLFAGILAAIYSMLYTSVKGWKMLRHRSDLVQSGRAVLERIGEDLENTTLMRLFPFLGGKESLSFPTMISWDESPGGEETVSARRLGRVQYRWEKNELEGTGKLVREWEVFLPEEGRTENKGSETFPFVISDFSFTYPYKNSGQSATPEWDGKWRNEKEIPCGVKIKMTLKSEDGQDELTLTKTVRIIQGQLGEPLK